MISWLTSKCIRRVNIASDRRTGVSFIDSSSTAIFMNLGRSVFPLETTDWLTDWCNVDFFFTWPTARGFAPAWSSRIDNELEELLNFRWEVEILGRTLRGFSPAKHNGVALTILFFVIKNKRNWIIIFFEYKKHCEVLLNHTHLFKLGYGLDAPEFECR